MPDYLSALAGLQSDFHAAIAATDADAPVAACPGWTVTDLVRHLAQVHHWAAARARHAEEEPLTVDADLAAHYAACAEELRRTLAGLDPDAPALTLNGEGPASFWHRRQVHETLVHLHDLRAAAGERVDDVEPDLWADTVDEAVTVMYPRQVRLGRTPPVPSAVSLVATDADQAWQLGEGEPVAVVAGPARDLALLLWSRIPDEDPALAVTGDRAALAETMAGRITP